MNSRSISQVLLLLFLTFCEVRAQYREIILSCHPATLSCDTFQVSEMDAADRIVRKQQFESGKSTTHFYYDSQQRLVRKERYDSTGHLQRIHKISYTGRYWSTDTLCDASGKTLLRLQQEATTTPGLYLVRWFFHADSVSSAEQRIQKDTTDAEISNSTCYAPDNCITYVFKYLEGRKLSMETWVLQPELNTPKLKETEEYAYSVDGQLIASTRFLEPEHRITAIFRYVKIPLSR